MKWITVLFICLCIAEGTAFVVQFLWNERQGERHEEQLATNARLQEITLDLAIRVKRIEAALGMDPAQPDKLKPLPKGELQPLPALIPDLAATDPAFQWMRPAPKAKTP